MGSWGDSAERRTDRMPKLRVQIQESRGLTRTIDPKAAVREAMMNDLGNQRVEDLPLDNTPRVPPRIRQAPKFKETSEALGGYLAMAKDGLDDDEAQGVRNLKDLGGANVYVESAGLARDVVANRHPNDAIFQEMKVSSNGIVLPPGAQLHRFPSSKANPKADVRIIHPLKSNKDSTHAAPQSGKANPPHLRKRIPEIQSPTGPHAKVQKTQPVSSKPVQADDAQTSEGTGNAARSLKTDDVLPEKPIDQPHASTTLATASGENASHDRLAFSGPCRTNIPGLLSDLNFKDVIVELRLLHTDENPQGQALFIVIYLNVAVNRHSLEGYRLTSHKGAQCIINFASSDMESVKEVRYNLKFPSEKNADDFLNKATLLQNCINYIAEMHPVLIDKAPKPEAKAIHDQSMNSGASVSLPKEDLPSVAKKAACAGPQDTAYETASLEPETTLQEIASFVPKVEASRTADKLTGMEDAFGKLSLDKVKVSSMYKLDRSNATPRVQYTPGELLDRRTAAEAPPGIRDGKIPLQNDRGTRLPPHFQLSRQKVANASPQATRSNGNSLNNRLAGFPQINEKSTKEILLEQKPLVAAIDSSAFTQATTLVDIEVEHNANATFRSTSGTTIVKTDSEEAPASETTVLDESLISWKTSKSEANAESVAATEQPASGRPVSPPSHANDKVATVSSAHTNPFTISAPIPKQEPIDRKTPVSVKTETSEQPTQVMGAASEPNPLFGFRAQYSQTHTPSIQGMPPAFATPQMTPNMGFQQMVFHPQMSQMLPGWNIPPPPPGKVHAISVTWHVSSEDTLAAVQPSLYHSTTEVNNPGQSPVFSPAAEPFRPQVQNQAPSTDSRFRRGLESSRFATGFTGAKYAGSFTGGSGSQ